MAIDVAHAGVIALLCVTGFEIGLCYSLMHEHGWKARRVIPALVELWLAAAIVIVGFVAAIAIFGR